MTRLIRLGNKVLGGKEKDNEKAKDRKQGVRRKKPEPEQKPDLKPPFSEYDSYYRIMEDGSIQAYIRGNPYGVYNPFTGTRYEHITTGDKNENKHW